MFYTTAERLNNIFKQGESILRVCETTSCEELRSLQKPNAQGVFQLVVVTDELYMRGIDYRAPTLGLDLMIDATFSSDRAYAQGLARVGRFGDPCERYKNGTKLAVDHAKRTELVMGMN